MAVYEIESRAAPQILTGSRRLLLFAQVVRLTWPGQVSGGLIWNRPSAVLIQEVDGSEWVLPIQDVTRQAQIFLLGLGLLGAFLIWLAKRHR